MENKLVNKEVNQAKKEVKSKKIEIRITESKKNLIDSICSKSNMSKSDLINNLLDSYISNHI